jgi:cell division protein FtsB
MKIAALTLIAALALIVATTAQATPKQHRQIVALRKQVAALQISNGQFRTEHDNLVQETASLSATVTSLQSNLRDMTGERDYYKNAPTELSRAVSTIQAERAYIERLDPAASDGYVISTAAMNYVVGHVLAEVYGYRVLNSMAIPWSAEMALETQAGICGTASFTFAAIVRQFGLPVRSVQFYHGANNHIAVETFYGGAWHYFDPTWGAVFSDSSEPVLSIAQARSGPFQLHQDQTLLWSQFTPLSDLSVLTDPTTVVEIGKDGL